MSGVLLPRAQAQAEIACIATRPLEVQCAHPFSVWLDNARGHLVDWSTQRWVQLSGRKIDLNEHPWLDGPFGQPTGIGRDFFDAYAARHALTLAQERPSGLIPDFDCLAAQDFDPEAISQGVRRFYQSTSDFDLDVWSDWCGAFRPGGWALAVLFSRRLQQLNLPLSGLDTSLGMTSDVKAVVDRESGRHQFTAWTRQLVGTGRIIYAGAYSTCGIPGQAGQCVRVVFPLPNGNAIVLMRPVAHPDGSLSLISTGERFGDPGFYFTVRAPRNTVWARYLRALREHIHVYESPDGHARADHLLTLWGTRFLRLHYRLRERARFSPSAAPSPVLPPACRGSEPSS
jgi:hypothetical protein